MSKTPKNTQTAELLFVVSTAVVKLAVNVGFITTSLNA